MADYAISYADLSGINSTLRTIGNNLSVINNNIDVVDSNVNQVNDNLKIVYSELEQLARDFSSYVKYQQGVNVKNNSQQRLIQIRQELDKKFGHYDEVRRTTTGILQANDLAIVKKETISNVTEELMLTTPGYWLTPCLIALAAWINDQHELAERAVIEGIKRNDEKSSLFWALICRRAERKSAALKWTQRYLENQDEEDLDKITVIILDAYASGLLGADSEGVISRQMTSWLEHLADKPGFIEQQTEQWSNAINLKRKPVDMSKYTYLSKYSRTWPVLQDIMEGAYLHSEILAYFTAIFEKEASTDSLKAQLDEILNSLVTDFDEAEAPLRKEERYHQFVVEFEGDAERAKRHMQIEQTAFDEHKDFTQLLTDAAMKPESSHSSISTQKFAIALSKDWITNAYNDVTAQNRAKIPNEIEINVDTFNDKTTDGQNETELVNKFHALVTQEKTTALAGVVMSGFDNFCLYGGIAIGTIGLIMMILVNIFLGALAVIAGVGLVINHFSKKKKVETNRQSVNDYFEKKRQDGTQIIRATLAEVVDFRSEFDEKDGESRKVVDFLEQITPEQYVRKLADTGRRVRISQ